MASAGLCLASARPKITYGGAGRVVGVRAARPGSGESLLVIRPAEQAISASSSAGHLAVQAHHDATADPDHLERAGARGLDPPQDLFRLRRRNVVLTPAVTPSRPH